MAKVAAHTVHALEIPTAAMNLLLPSACVAEVVPAIGLAPVPFSESWVMGLASWRLRPVPVVSMEVLMGKPAPAMGARSRMVVLYPLPGRKPTEFIGILAAGEPMSRVIDASAIAMKPAGGNPPGIALCTRVGERELAIPDYDLLKKLFYPG
jgi:chemotaxis signal transduction protein